jgi:hypothetical protein
MRRAVGVFVKRVCECLATSGDHSLLRTIGAALMPEKLVYTVAEAVVLTGSPGRVSRGCLRRRRLANTQSPKVSHSSDTSRWCDLVTADCSGIE